MSKKLWEANLKVKKKSNLYEFEKFVSKKFNYKPSKNYKKLFEWSIKNLDFFWSSVWDYTKVKGIKINKFKFTKEFIKNKFFIGSKLFISFLVVSAEFFVLLLVNCFVEKLSII